MSWLYNKEQLSRNGGHKLKFYWTLQVKILSYLKKKKKKKKNYYVSYKSTRRFGNNFVHYVGSITTAETWV